MARHSKWHNIQVRKGKMDAVRANVFTKLARSITMAAKEGGGDPETNFSLRLALDKAKASNMPKDNIERAVKRGIGTSTGEAALEAVLYEGYGPAGVGILVDAVTDNKNRTTGEIKHVFSTHGGSLVPPGGVQWMFERKGVVRLSSQYPVLSVQHPDLELALIDAGADNIVAEEEGTIVYTAVERLQTMSRMLETHHVDIVDAGIEWLPKEKMEVEQETEQRIMELLEAVDALDDVREVYTNI